MDVDGLMASRLGGLLSPFEKRQERECWPILMVEEREMCIYTCMSVDDDDWWWLAAV